MRFIDISPDELQIPDDWKAKAEQLTKDLINEADPTKRKELIDNNAHVWGEIKPLLEKLSDGKCWYTEAKQEGTDTDVDHYRPKKKVSEEDDNNEGYWWLSFEARNYRLSCIVANRRRKDKETGITGGKGSHFPLCVPENRATTPNCDLDGELPELLDPCDEVDVALLTFAENGEALPRHSSDSSSRFNQRASKSIELYNLNYHDFKNARIGLRDRLKELRTDAAKNYKKLAAGDAAHKEAYRQTIRDLKKYLKPEQPYSSFCKTYLENYRHEEHLLGVF